MRIATSHRAFYGDFCEFFSELGLIRDPEETKDYDLIIFTGGEDVDPMRYGEDNHGSYFNSRRDDIEFAIMTKALELNKKILGVCRGHQLIAVANGGRLYQDIFDDLGANHHGYHSLLVHTPHPVLDVLPKQVNSLHHQGIRELGPNFDLIADWQGVPEVIASKNNNILGVQFHPEFMGLAKFFAYVKAWADVTTTGG